MRRPKMAPGRRPALRGLSDHLLRDLGLIEERGRILHAAPNPNATKKPGGTPVESQTKAHQDIHDSFRDYLKHMPGWAEAYHDMASESYKDGEVPAVTKRLMALCAALTHGCQGCILFQTQHALDLGATPGQIMETCAVAASLGGTMAAAETAKVMRFMREKELV